MTPYLEVPVRAAQLVSDMYDKAIVVIVSWDVAHNRVHVTTYGRSAEHKQPAAVLGDILAAAAGTDLSKLRVFEDFRHRTAAQWAEEKGWLLARIRTMDTAIRRALDDAERSTAGPMPAWIRQMLSASLPPANPERPEP